MNIVAFIAIALVSAAAIFTWFQWNKTQLQSKNQAIQIEITKAGTMLELDKLIESLKVAKQLQKLQHLGEATLKGHSAGITDVNFSPDGQIIISASDDKTIKIWDWKKETLIDSRNRHSAGVTDVNMSKDKDGQIIASASTDGTVVVWNWTLKLDDLSNQGCGLAKDYLKNPNNGMNENDPQRLLCDDVKKAQR